MRPPPRQTIHEWAEASRIIARGTSPRAGRWRSRPFQKPVLEAITDPRNIEGVLYVKASQNGGGTELLLNTIGYFMEADPSPQIFVTFSVEMAQKLSKTRIAPMIRETECLSGKVREARTRDSGNTVLQKLYDGGEWDGVGANSPGGLSMAPKRVALFDEIDRYEVSAGTEGDPIALALMRLEAYWNRVTAYVTSPGIKDTSASWKLWQRSDQREWHVTCPHCEFRTWLKWAHVSWEKDERGRHRPETAAYVCEGCGVAWSDVERWQACDAGGYQATADFYGLAGFRISALAISGVTLEHIVRKWLSAQGNPEELKVFKNTVLAEWWDHEYGKVPDDTGLMARREVYEEREGRPVVPASCALLTAGVDLQDNRFEVSVYGWGAGEESWHLWHEVLWFGSPSSPDRHPAQSDWDALDAFLLKPWPSARGGLDFIRGACVDTGGHHTQAAYDFCGARFRRQTPDGGGAFLFAIKGSRGSGQIWPRAASTITPKVPLWIVRVDPAKAQIYGRLAIQSAGQPGYVHFPMREEAFDLAFFKGLTAEKCEQTLDKRTRKPVFVWKMKKAGDANEPLDCAVYAYAALCGLKANGFSLDTELAALATRPVFVTPTAQAAVATGQPQAPPGRARRESGGESWLGDTSRWLGG